MDFQGLICFLRVKHKLNNTALHNFLFKRHFLKWKCRLKQHRNTIGDVGRSAVTCTSVELSKFEYTFKKTTNYFNKINNKQHL